jgi:crotonobetainyl-CoA:carnitine CoA-transferase CaiB-like acyl-CoA transferase
MYHEGQRRHLAVTPVNTPAAVACDPHLAARNYFVEVEQYEEGAVRLPGAPYRHARTPWRISRPAPRAGEHNREVYCQELGVSEERFGALQEAGVI